MASLPLRLSSVGRQFLRMFGIDPALLPRALGTSGTTHTNLREKTHIGPPLIQTEVRLDEQ